MPSYVFVGEGRSQCNVTPVQIELIIAELKCVYVSQPKVSSFMENIMKTKKLTYLAVCKRTKLNL